MPSSRSSAPLATATMPVPSALVLVAWRRPWLMLVPPVWKLGWVSRSVPVPVLVRERTPPSWLIWLSRMSVEGGATSTVTFEASVNCPPIELTPRTERRTGKASAASSSSVKAFSRLMPSLSSISRRPPVWVLTEEKPNAPSAAFGLTIGYLQGLQGSLLLDSPWTRLLTRSPHELSAVVTEASRQGWLRYKSAGAVTEITFPGLLPDKEGRVA